MFLEEFCKEVLQVAKMRLSRGRIEITYKAVRLHSKWNIRKGLELVKHRLKMIVYIGVFMRKNSEVKDYNFQEGR